MTKNFKELFELLKPHIIHFTWVGFFIRKEFHPDAEVVGVNAKASSIVRKDYTMNRINREIQKLKLPFRVVDTNEATPFFQILINE